VTAGAIAILVLANTLVPPGPALTNGSAPCRGAPIRPGDDVQRLLDAESGGATVCFGAGIYRLAGPLIPADGQRLLAAPGAVLTGAVRLDEWQQDGANWHVRGELPTKPTLHGECATGTLCQYTNTVYMDDRPMKRVGSRDLVGPGRFWTDHDANSIWIGDDPTDRRIEVARAPAAIAGGAKDVVVQGFVVEKFANPAQRGAIHFDGGGWRIERNDVRANHGMGIYAIGGQVLHNHIHHNGQLGLGGSGDDLLVEGNQIDHNNTAGFSPLWEAGGTKFVRTDGLVIRGNNVHDNMGQGLWTDINNIRTTIERNHVHANSGHGIFHEISYRAVIRGNHVTDNGGAEPMPGWGGAGIRVAASPDVEIYGNSLAGNQNAIMLLQQRRDDWPSSHGAHLLRNIEVHDNQVSLESPGLTGQVDDTESAASYERNVRFVDNTYRLPSADAKVFAWRGMAWDPAAWRQRFHQDASSAFIAS
jgi:Right handed beta helix region